MKIANPQGKGNLPALQALQAARPEQVPPKTPRTVLSDYCLSALVLGARFSFKPVPAKPYYLYRHRGEWALSLIGPHEWPDSVERQFVATCELRTDMTWSVELIESLGEDIQLALDAHVTAFQRSLAEAGSLEAGLPYYVAGLPYYQRVLASGLAVSLGYSIARLDAPQRAQLEQLALPA